MHDSVKICINCGVAEYFPKKGTWSSIEHSMREMCFTKLTRQGIELYEKFTFKLTFPFNGHMLPFHSTVTCLLVHVCLCFCFPDLVILSEKYL